MSDANTLLLDAYGRVGESVPVVLEGLSPDQAAYRPDGEANSIVWLVWHLTRVIDSHLAELTGEEQVHTAQGYAERLGLDLPADDTGFSHGSDEVARVVVEDLDALVGYHRAVQERATAYLGDVSGFDEVVDDRWDPPVTLGVRLVSVADDAARHVGQAEYVRGLVDRRG